MKKRLLVVFLFIGLLNSLLTNAQEVMTSVETKREVPLKADKPGQPGDILRSPAVHPAEASVCGELLTIDFLYPVSSITITLTNVSTGEVVYWEVYEMAGNAVIDLSAETPGEYQLKLTSPQWCLRGSFSYIEMATY